MALISVTTAGQLADALENWMIDNKCNPKTPEEWDKCMNDLIKAGIVTPLAIIPDENVGDFKKGLQDNSNVEEI